MLSTVATAGAAQHTGDACQLRTAHTARKTNHSGTKWKTTETGSKKERTETDKLSATVGGLLKKCGDRWAAHASISSQWTRSDWKKLKVAEVVAAKLRRATRCVIDDVSVAVSTRPDTCDELTERSKVRAGGGSGSDK